MKISFFFLVLLIMFAQGGVKKPRELADYTPRTLNELAQLNAASVENVNGNIIVQGDIVPSRVRVVYEGTSKPLVKIRKNAIGEWTRRYAGAPEYYTRHYETEVLFSEGERKYWLVVRKELLPVFEKELKKGDVVELYLIKLGGVRNGDTWESVLLVEKFTKP